MPTFTYKAQTEDGSPVSGTMEADSPPAVAAQLDSMGYFPISITEKKGFSFDDLVSRFERVKIEDLIFFTRQLLTITKSGIPLLSGLKALEQQTENKKLKHVISMIAKDVDQGKSFSSALAKYPDIFPELYVNMIEAGELGGTLDDILDRLIFTLEFNMKTSTNLKAAMRYPVFVVVSLCVAFGIVVTLVIPKFSVIFERSTMDLPAPTRIMLLLNFVVQTYWYYLLFGIGMVAIAFFIYIRQESGRLNWDHLKLRIPIVGPIFLKIYMSRFSSMLETLSRSGVSIDTALDVVSRTLGNAYLALKTREIAEKVRSGRGITDSLRESDIFPPLVVRMVFTGEESGSLDDMLREVTNYYEREIDYSVSRLSSYIEPVLTVGLGIMVLFMALAIFLPWWDMIKTFKVGR
ncbi:MAG: type II secretion system F family protein [Deltaproteobacteria bacterium]|nr:type II secretion system F family protein [Deltaproteobacteria bacterium]MBW2020396.1 type II secretion system F family protein [Deltaproteobacteria bacterium]MBW2074674.1 type II secretion system F family protein [Deltaproteobacteria bacterium]RLB82552.1 MAG: type II secretion system F family protein [Deltaproteobacteria bacterium]